MIYLFYAGSNYGGFLLKMRQCVEGLCRLLEWNIRKTQDAKNLAILQVFHCYRENHLNAAHAWLVKKWRLNAYVPFLEMHIFPKNHSLEFYKTCQELKILQEARQ